MKEVNDKTQRNGIIIAYCTKLLKRSPLG